MARSIMFLVKFKRNRLRSENGQAMLFAVACIAIASAIGLVAITAVGRSLSTEARVRRQNGVDSLAISASEEVFGRLANSINDLSVITSHPGYSTGTDVDSTVWVRFGADGQVASCTTAKQTCFTVRLGLYPNNFLTATSGVIQVTARQCRAATASNSSCVFARRQTTIRSRLFSDHVIWVNSATSSKFVTGDLINGPIRLNTASGSFAYCGAPEIGIDTSVTPNVSYRVETLGSATTAVASGCTSVLVPVMSTNLVPLSDTLAIPVVSASDYAGLAGTTITSSVASPAAIVVVGDSLLVNGISRARPTNGVLYIDGPATLRQTSNLVGTLTIVATGDIAITSDLQLNSQVDDKLAIVSTAGNINIAFASESRIIEALLLAPSLTAGTGIVQATNISSCTGATCVQYALVVYGAIVARELGALALVATSTGAIQRGFSKAFTYDTRLATSQPPYAISQVRGRWMRLAMSTVAPLTPGISGIAPTTTVADTAGATVVFTPPTSPSSSRTLSYRLTFSERMSGLAAADFSNTGTATGCVFAPSSPFGVTITLSVVCGSDGTVIVRLAANSVIDATNNTGPAAAASASSVTIRTTAAGLYTRGYYITSHPPTRTDNASPNCTSVQLDIAFANSTRTTMAGCTATQVMLHLTGFITVPTATAAFKVSSDDGVYVTINGTSFGSWIDRGCATDTSSTMSFTAGSTVALDAWYYEWGGGECFILQWDIGAGFVNVPASAFTYLP